ncbi:MAG: tetratricopeptide repeat protein, partial [Chitinivibrionales bacterium]|nr:tetratricopeptide repeat protein [Chitinivibrionales bacterium]
MRFLFFSERHGVAIMRSFSRSLPLIRFALIFISACCISPVSADESDAVFNLAQRFYRDSLYNLALEQYEKYLDIKKRAPENDPVAYYRIAVCYYRMENPSQASPAFEKFIKLFPSDDNIMDAMFYAGITRKATGDYKKASDWFYGVWSRFVGSVRAREALYQAAVSAEKDKNIDRAVELYDIFFRRFPEHKQAGNVALSLARMLMENKELSKAEDILIRAEKRRSSDKTFPSRLYYYRAVLARTMQNTKKAAEYFAAMQKKHAGFFPEFEQGYKEYIVLLADQKKYAPTLPLYEKLAHYYESQSIQYPDGFFLSYAEASR